jgi:hypothetical protein
VSINDGNVQRSMVKQVVVVFSQPIALSDGALTVKRRGGGPIANVTVSADNPSHDGVTWVLTFSGDSVVGGSLPDGAYKVLAANGIADIAGNAMQATFRAPFYRLFGDINGNRVVSRAELVSMRSALGQPASTFWYLDYNAGGSIDLADYRALRLRLLRRLI